LLTQTFGQPSGKKRTIFPKVTTSSSVSVTLQVGWSRDTRTSELLGELIHLRYPVVVVHRSLRRGGE